MKAMALASKVAQPKRSGTNLPFRAASVSCSEVLKVPGHPPPHLGQ
jgi:hypothetical protein